MNLKERTDGCIREFGGEREGGGKDVILLYPKIKEITKRK